MNDFPIPWIVNQEVGKDYNIVYIVDAIGKIVCTINDHPKNKLLNEKRLELAEYIVNKVNTSLKVVE